MKHRLWFISGAIALFATFGSGPTESQVIDPSTLDHLKCYRIRDQLQPTKYVADLKNQFGLEPGCVIAVPARLMCVETEKTIISTPPPPGGGPHGEAAGHFLCYATRCPESPPLTAIVQDQFGRRPVVVDRARIVCAPANKLICGDGEIDPGEQCDPGSAATNVCPGGTPCRPDCSCPGQECVCGTTCLDSSGNAGQCQPVDPATGVCECRTPPGGCPCGVTCLTSSGQAGQCQPIAGSTLCECRPVSNCPCGSPCVDPVTEESGRCEPVAGSNVCECKVPPPPDCPCEATCVRNGATGICRNLPGLPPGICDCFIPPPPQCPCNASCAKDGKPGVCRPLPGLPPGVCDCFTPPPGECECGKPCTTASGVVGKCKGSPNGCRCEEPPPPAECKCGKECLTSDGKDGKCRPLAGLPPGVCGCAAR